MFDTESFPERIFEKVNFENKSADNNKSMKKYPECKKFDCDFTHE